jgi:hypothetical protein
MIRFWSSVWKSFFVKLFFHMSYQVLVIFFFTAILGFKLRTLHLLGRLSTSWATLPSHFALVIFEIGICFFCLGQSGPWSFYYKLIAIAERWQVWTTVPSYWLRWGLMNFLPALAMNSDPPWFPLPASQVTRITAMSHLHPTNH